MLAMQMTRIVSLLEEDEPLTPVDIPTPAPRPHEVLIRVTACGVCHTELDELEGRTPPPRLPVTLGHEVVGRIEELGAGVVGLAPGQRVGVGWIHSSSGSTDENLDPGFRATGRDVNGGYAEYMTAPARYVYSLPDSIEDVQAAPLLCAGAIGYRALKLSGLKDGQRLGLTGFGGSAHIVLQLTRHLYPKATIHVFARDARSREFALALGADWAGNTTDRVTPGLHAIIDTTPAWTPVVEALANLAPGGRLIINAIRKEDGDRSALQQLSYHQHLWMEREIKSVANITHFDIAEFLPIAARIPIRSEVQTYPLLQANSALVSLKRESVRGAKVLLVQALTQST